MPDRPVDPLLRRCLRGALVASMVAVALVPAGSAARERAATDADLIAASAALARMPLADRAAQLVTTRVPGTVLDARTRLVLERLRPGGVIVFADNYRSRSQMLRLTRSLQVAIRGGDAGRPGVVVSIDQEGGVVRRIADAPPTRSHPQLGATNRPALTRLQALDTAHVLARLGIRLDLAPVADLDIGPRRVMRERSFGSSPALVATHVAAFVDGLRAGGGASAVKHFPGFGGASVNSDDALARVTRTRAQLQADLVPFRSAITADTDAVMVSHAVYTRIDRGHPASTSRAVYRLLRGELGYTGLAITDSLHASGFGAATHLTVPDGCVAAIAAGADVVLLTGSVGDAVACRARVLVAVRSGRLPRARLDEAVLRVLRLKARLGLLPPPVSSPGLAD